MRGLGPGLIAIVTALSVGCALVPVPTASHTGAYKAIGDDSLTFIEIGRTTREDLLLRLGAPSVAHRETFVYGTEKHRWILIILCCLAAWPYGAAMFDATDTVEFNTYRPLIVEFDERSIVAAWRWGEPERRTRHSRRPRTPTPPPVELAVRSATLADVQTRLASDALRGARRFEAKFEGMRLMNPDIWELRRLIQEAMGCSVSCEVRLSGAIEGTTFEARMRKDSKSRTRVKFQGVTFQDDRQMAEFVEPFTVEQGPEEFTLEGLVAGRRVKFKSP